MVACMSGASTRARGIDTSGVPNTIRRPQLTTRVRPRVMMPRTLRQASSPPRTLAAQDPTARPVRPAERAADLPRLALEGVGPLLAPREGAVLVLELVHGDGGQGGGGVVLGFVVVHFVDGVGGVHDCGLDRLLLDDGLDGLVDMVMDMLATNNGVFATCVLRLAHGAVVFELRPLGL